jgi:hypothetical protein
MSGVDSGDEKSGEVEEWDVRKEAGRSRTEIEEMELWMEEKKMKKEVILDKGW